MFHTRDLSEPSSPARGTLNAIPDQAGVIGEPRLSWAPVFGGLASFVLVGGVSAMYGPILPSLRTAFTISATSAGLALSMQFLGEVAGVVVSGMLGARVHIRLQLAAGLSLILVGCITFATVAVWPIALAGIFLIGLGGGGLIISLNTLFASGFGQRGPVMLNVLNAAYGGGAILGPIVVGTLARGAFRPVFLLGGVASLAVIPFVLKTPHYARSEDTVAWPTERRALGILTAFIVLFALYVGLEADIGGWEVTELVAGGSSQVDAARTTALFWAALTVGRLLIAPMSHRISPPRFILAALLSVIVLMALAHLHVVTAWVYTLAGLALAPIFPLSFVWLQQSLAAVRSAGTLALLGALVGGATFPLLVGRLIAISTPDVLPNALLAIAVLAFSTVWRLQRMTQG